MNYRDFLAACILDAYEHATLNVWDAIEMILAVRGSLPFDAVGL